MKLYCIYISHIQTILNQNLICLNGRLIVKKLYYFYGKHSINLNNIKKFQCNNDGDNNNNKL